MYSDILLFILYKIIQQHKHQWSVQSCHNRACSNSFTFTHFTEQWHVATWNADTMVRRHTQHSGAISMRLTPRPSQSPYLGNSLVDPSVELWPALVKSAVGDLCNDCVIIVSLIADHSFSPGDHSYEAFIIGCASQFLLQSDCAYFSTNEISMGHVQWYSNINKGN